MLRKLLVLATALATFAVVAAPAFAAKGGGNSPNAKGCQKGGWQTQARTEDPATAFTSVGECTSYAAKGGTLTDLQVGWSSAAQDACEWWLGTFVDERPTSFQCYGLEFVLNPNIFTDPVFAQACADIGGVIRISGAGFVVAVTCD